MLLSDRRREQVNMVVLGLGFTVLFSSYNTLTNLMKPFLVSVSKDVPQFKADGYIANSIIFLGYGIFLSVSPAVVSRIKSTTIMLFGAIGFGLNVAAYYTSSSLMIYLGAALNGCTGAFLWAGQGRYVMLNSQPNTIASNTAIFWVFYKCSLLFGNSFVYVLLSHDAEFDKQTRSTIVSGLLSLNVVAVIILFFLKSPLYENTKDGKTAPLKELASAWRKFLTTNVLILFVMIIYTGMQSAFNSGVLAAAVGFTKQLGPDSAKLVPLIGIFLGIGGILSGALMILCGGYVYRYKWGGTIVVVVGVLIELTGYGLEFLYLPNSSVFGDTYDRSYWQSNVYVVLGSATAIGVGDGLTMSQVYSLLKMMFPQDCARIMPLFVSFYTCSGAVMFYGGTIVGLHSQLIVLIVTGVIGIIVFTIVTYRVTRIKNQSTSQKEIFTVSSNTVNAD